VRKLADFCAGNFYGAQERLFDILLGVSTTGLSTTKDSICDGEGDGCFYQGCQWLTVRRSLKALNPGASDVFVDLGSGKGKALLIAGQLPYRHVIGVEIDQGLSRWAGRNIDRARPRLRAKKVESLTGNVLEWPIPDDTSVIFMFNPFIDQTFSGVMSRIFESYDCNPRVLHIVYQHPWEHDRLLSTGRVVVNDIRSSTWPGRLRWWRGGDVIVSYQVVGRTGSNRLEARRSRRIFRSRRAIQRWSVPNGHNFSMQVPGSHAVYTRFNPTSASLSLHLRTPHITLTARGR
jgi:SAM-dependent methyltransferase